MIIAEKIKKASRNLRQNMTESEIILWSFIRWWKIWAKFMRQHPIYVFTENNWLDRYIIPDFYCHESKLIIEIDWSIHNIKEVYELDKVKENILKNMWFNIIRIKNLDIKTNINNVIQSIKKYI